jgi:putative effector of murein hydrolase LrgA (UPF0299 family)
VLWTFTPLHSSDVSGRRASVLLIFGFATWNRVLVKSISIGVPVSVIGIATP